MMCISGCLSIIIIIKRCKFAIPPTLVPRANGGNDDEEVEEKEGLAA
jgi:hypothetical protein